MPHDFGDRFRLVLGTVIVVTYLAFAVWSSINPKVSIPSGLGIGVGAFAGWLYMPALRDRLKGRR